MIRTTVKWYIFVSSDGTLYFQSVTRDDVGDYFCMVTVADAQGNFQEGKVSEPIPLEVTEAGKLWLFAVLTVNLWNVSTNNQTTLWASLLYLHKPTHNTTTVLRPFFGTTRVSQCQKTWTLWCKGRLTEADTQTIRLGATPSGLTSAHLHHPPFFYRPDALPAAQPTVSHPSTDGN